MKIQSPLSVGECVTLLKSATVNESPFGTMFLNSGTIICKFNGNNFRLRQKRSYRNSFCPFFYGKMIQTEKGAEISGEFRIHPFVVAFMALWFGFLILGGGIIFFTSLTQLVTGHYDHTKEANPLVGIFVPIIMAIFGIALVKFGKWLGRSEEANMTSLLQELFSSNPKSTVPILLKPETPKEMTMWLPILLLSLMALLSVTACFTGISSFQTSASSTDPKHTGATITYFHDQRGRWLAFANGVFLGSMAYGIWKRYYLVWKLGFLLIAASVVSFVFNGYSDITVLSKTPGSQVLVFTIFITVGALAVGTYWTVWWFKKKDYFNQ
jgi:hypothetical protein